MRRSPVIDTTDNQWTGAADPIKIGWLGSALDGPDGGYNKIHRMAFDEAGEQGLIDRPVEFVLHAENGLPNGSARNATDGFRYLVDQGCIGVAGAYSSDNAMVVAPLANELKVPLISWAGTEQLAASTASGSETATAEAMPRCAHRGWPGRGTHGSRSSARSRPTGTSTSGSSVKSAVDRA